MRLQPDAGAPARRRDRSSRPASWCRSRSRAGRGRRTCTATRAAAPGAGPGAAQPVRPGGVGARADRAALRLPLPHRDLRPGRQAGARLLRAAVPARRPDRGPGRPQGRPARPGAAAGQGGVRRAGRARPTPPRSWPPSCARWPAGWAWTTSWWASAATWRPRSRTRSAVVRASLTRLGSMSGPTSRPPPAPHSRSLEHRACHPRQAPPHRRGQDPAPARGRRQGRQRHRGRLRRDERRRAAGDDRRAQAAPPGRRDPRRPDAGGVRHRARGRPAGAGPAALRRAGHGRRRAAPGQHRGDEDR